MNITYSSGTTRHDPLGLALIAAAVIHSIFILGVGFDINRDRPAQPERTLDVTVVRPVQQQQEPEEADFLANASQQGATDLEGDTRPTAPPSLKKPVPKQQAAQELVRTGSPEAEPKPTQKIVSSIKNPVKQDDRQQKEPVKALTMDGDQAESDS